MAEALPILHTVFSDLEKIAGLSLNRPKCVLIPLWPSTKEQVRHEIAVNFSDWAQIAVEYSGTYLGVVIGPDSVDSFWKKAVKKYLDRASMWGQLGLGLNYSTLAYTAYVFPVLSFLAQFKKPDDAVLQAERKALSLMVPGPYLWCKQDDYYHLGSLYGQACSFPRLDHFCLAARARLHQFENQRYGGLHIERKFTSIQSAICEIHDTRRLCRWSFWFKDGLTEDIHDSCRELAVRGLHLPTLIDLAGGQQSEDLSPTERARKIKKNFQKTVRKELQRASIIDPVARMRHKLDRWALPGIPAHTASRCSQALQDLRSWVPPRICSAVLRTMWNARAADFNRWGNVVWDVRH